MELAPIRKSLLRRITWYGGDRRLIGVSGLILIMMTFTIIVGYGFFDGLPYLLFTVLLFGALLWFAKSINEADPWMVDITIRSLSKYKKYYPAHSDIGVAHPEVRDFNS